MIFKSLAYVKLSGEVKMKSTYRLPTYNGELSVNIFDKNYIKPPYNNDGQ